MPCGHEGFLKTLIRLIIPSPVHVELDVAIDSVEKLLIALPIQLQQAQAAGTRKWQVFATASPVAANTLARRWQNDRFAENMVAFYLAGLAGHTCSSVLRWMGALSEQDWDDFLEIMKINPGMRKWLAHFHQPVPASRLAAQIKQQKEGELRRRFLLNQRHQIRTRT